MEKKLTDEEIVKVLDTCFMAGGNGDCGKCGLFTGNGLGECMRTVAVETLDLIYGAKMRFSPVKKLKNA